jgi:hypothetical protein
LTGAGVGTGAGSSSVAPATSSGYSALLGSSTAGQYSYGK